MQNEFIELFGKQVLNTILADVTYPTLKKNVLFVRYSLYIKTKTVAHVG